MEFTTLESKPSFDEMEVKLMEAFWAGAATCNRRPRKNNIYLIYTIRKAIGVRGEADLGPVRSVSLSVFKCTQDV